MIINYNIWIILKNGYNLKFWNDPLEQNDSIPTNMYLSLGNRSEKSEPGVKNLSKPLVEVAAEQKHVNYHLCLFHYQLVRILYLIVNIFSLAP